MTDLLEQARQLADKAQQQAKSREDIARRVYVDLLQRAGDQGKPRKGDAEQLANSCEAMGITLDDFELHLRVIQTFTDAEQLIGRDSGVRKKNAALGLKKRDRLAQIGRQPQGRANSMLNYHHPDPIMRKISGEMIANGQTLHRIDVARKTRQRMLDNYWFVKELFNDDEPKVSSNGEATEGATK